MKYFFQHEQCSILMPNIMTILQITDKKLTAMVFPWLFHEVKTWAVLLGEGDELNIVFRFVILMSQTYIQRNKLRYSIWNKFTVLRANTNNFWWCPAQRDCGMRSWGTIIKVTEGLHNVPWKKCQGMLFASAVNIRCMYSIRCIYATIYNTTTG